MTQEEITPTMHHPGSTLPAVRPCDTPNGSDTQVHWAGEQIHRITGCRRLKNYKQLLQVTSDGKWVDTGEFPMSLGTYSTIRKAAKGKPIDRTLYRYLDKVHANIGFGDTIAVGGARYVLVFVDRATRYNWVFPLTTLSSENILAAFNLFRSEAGGFAKCFRTDCNEKLFGKAIKYHLTLNKSNIIVAPPRSSILHQVSGKPPENHGPHVTRLPYGKANAPQLLVLFNSIRRTYDERDP